MPVVVADAGPPHYLVLIGAIDLLPSLFGAVIIPDVVKAELSRPRAPAAVRAWIASSPPWLASRPASIQQTPQFPKLDEGERDAIALAQAIGADLILMDDRAGAAAARALGLEVTGTLGVLIRAAARGLVDLPQAATRLKATNFRYPPDLLDELVAQHRQGGGPS